MDFREPADQQVLRTVRILVLVDHHEPELRRVLGPHPLGLLHQVDRLQQQIVEVERIALLQRLDVIRIHLRDLFVARVPGRLVGDRLGPFHAVLGAADARQGEARLDEAVVDVQALQRLFDDH